MKNLIISASLLLSTVALAEPNDASPHRMPAPRNALELALATSLAHGTGDLAGGMPVANVGDSGAGIDAAIGWRATPNLLLGGYMNLSAFGDQDLPDRGAVTFAVGLKADWHFLPTASIDPWVSVGTGVKFMGFEAGDNDRALTGLELGKVQVGIDFRVNPRFAIGPVIAASATVFNHQYDQAVSDDAMRIDDRKVNWTFSAGLLGRFDIGGTTR